MADPPAGDDGVRNGQWWWWAMIKPSGGWWTKDNDDDEGGGRRGRGGKWVGRGIPGYRGCGGGERVGKGGDDGRQITGQQQS